MRCRIPFPHVPAPRSASGRRERVGEAANKSENDFRVIPNTAAVGSQRVIPHDPAALQASSHAISKSSSQRFP